MAYLSDARNAARGISVRGWLVLIVLAASLPILLLAIALVAQLTAREWRAKNEALQYSARLVLGSIDNETARYLRSGQALASSPALLSADLTRFREEADRTLAALPHANLIVADPDGRIVVDTSASVAAPVPQLTPDMRAHGRRAFETQSAQVGALLPRSPDSAAMVSIALPVFRANHPAYQLFITIQPERFRDLLVTHSLPQGWTATIADRSGTFVARSLPGDWTGQLAAPGLKSLISQEGLFDFVSREGVTFVAATAVSPLTGWTVAVGQEKAAFTAPILRTLKYVTGGGLVVTLIGVAFAAWMARRLTAPVASIEASAAALENGLQIAAKRSGIPEFDRALQAFDHAAKTVIDNQRALRESEQRSSLAQDAAQAGVWEWVLADNSNVWSEPIWTLFGLPRAGQEPSFAAWVTAIHPDDREHLIEEVRSAAAAGLEFEIQWRVKTPPGTEERWLLSRGRPIAGPEGKIERYVGITIDVSGRKRMEESLRESQRRIAAILAALPIGVALIDRDGATLVSNDFFARYAPGRVPSRDAGRVALWEGHLPGGERRTPEDFPAARALRGERVWPGEDFMYHGDATRGPIWTRIAAIPLLDENGAVEGATVVIADIDDERRALDALQASEEEFRTFFENDAVGAVELRLDGRFIKTNARFREITGRSPSELEQLTPSDLAHPDDRANDAQLLSEFLGGRAPTYFNRKRLLRKDGSFVWVEVTAGMVRDRNGNPLRTAGIVQDVTERLKAEESLRESESRLLHAARLSEIGRMAAALAHEVNQPLTAVANYMGGGRRLIRAGLDDEHRRTQLLLMMEKANAQALRAGEIIRRLREFVGIGDSERTIEDATRVLQDAVVLATIAAKHNGVSVEAEFCDSGRVLVDKIQIQQVVLNLVRNAIEAMESSYAKTLTLRLKATKDHVEFSVADTGCGLSSTMSDRLFRPFSSTKDSGMGIGLSVCREIIEAHGGKIWADPARNGGTVFHFTLPLLLDNADIVAEAAGDSEIPVHS